MEEWAATLEHFAVPMKRRNCAGFPFVARLVCKA
jgi:hypothetical protein